MLNETQIYRICAEAFEKYRLTEKRLLVIVPDHSRTAPMDVMFRVVYKLLADRTKQLDFLIALGTHPPMSEDAINRRMGISTEERKTMFSKARFFNHEWKNPEKLQQIGTIDETEVADISNGLMHQAVTVTINKMVFDYDVLMIIGPTFPHEVVGFSGGNKYLFPGIAGQEIIDLFHWLGALITSPVIIGNLDTPVRRVVDKAASFVPMERVCLSLVVKGERLVGLFIDTPERAVIAAAELSRKVHIIYKDRPFHQVLSCAPDMYDDLWTGGKCMYKLEPVVADNGSLIIYAPHITQISITHGKLIEKIGYHVRDYFLKQMNRFKDIPGGVMAHSTHVKGIGSFENGIEKPRIDVVLATQIPQKLCQKINLHYRNPLGICLDDWRDHEDEGFLLVPKAGEILYRLKNDPFQKS